jgi:uncharacterized RDD family membrane protein YckC
MQENQELKEYQSAGFWKRWWASVLDTIILNIPLLIIFWFLFQDRSPDFSVVDIAQMLVAMIIVIAFWLKWNGMTPGKGIMKIRIVRLDNTPVTTGQSIIRYIGYFISMIPLGIGYFMVAFRKDKRALHDLIAKTKVIYDPEVED